MHFVERRTARIDGWHRAFCLSTLVGRGSTNNPGLVLGLDVGGGCAGIAFRCDDVQEQLTLLGGRK
jgi:cation transport protein ChaC